MPGQMLTRLILIAFIPGSIKLQKHLLTWPLALDVGSWHWDLLMQGQAVAPHPHQALAQKQTTPSL